MYRCRYAVFNTETDHILNSNSQFSFRIESRYIIPNVPKHRAENENQKKKKNSEKLLFDSITFTTAVNEVNTEIYVCYKPGIYFHTYETLRYGRYAHPRPETRNRKKKVKKKKNQKLYWLHLILFIIQNNDHILVTL